jgi:UDP-glucose 4-epimerase
LENPQVINHHAAQISVTASSRDPIGDARINAQGLLNVLQCSVQYGVQKIIFISTGGAIYGDTEQMPTAEEFHPQPLTPYAIHKYLGEQYLRFYHHQYGLEYTVLRYANVYGPRQNPHGEAGVVAIFISSLIAGKTPTLYAYPGEPAGMTRDYVFVEDAARANLLSLEQGNREIINIGTSVPTTTRVLYRQIAECLRSNIQPVLDQPRPGDLRKSCLDIHKAHNILGWQPMVDLPKGIGKTVRYFSDSVVLKRGEN